MSNSLGEIFRITSFGESHGRCIGIVIDGCPAGLALDAQEIQKEVDRRRPSVGTGQTARAEEDQVEVLSGLFEGRTTGAPICLVVWNKDVQSVEYQKNRFIPRPGHADFTAFVKYGGFNDFRGGGRFSGRVTVGLVMAGAVARKLLARLNIEILAHTIQIGEVKAPPSGPEIIRENVYKGPLRCADAEAGQAMMKAIEQAGKEGDSLGGVIECLALNLPVGLGEPFFSTLEGEISRGLFAIPAVKGVEFGSGFSAADKKGSQNNDSFVVREKRVETVTNQAGGVLGGIANGMPLVIRAAVKPTPSISRIQRSIDLEKMENVELMIKGRHDVCIVPRAVPVVELVLAVTICDLAIRAGIIARVIE